LFAKHKFFTSHFNEITFPEKKASWLGAVYDARRKTTPCVDRRR
jgi:hypothetical protein